ncbi:aminotransferase class III-fold pyridoxal phosphate-dependent enzyme [Nocardia stercoris]|uniref:Aminotransferase class III-fold pyridoxal phosphate-dependent enzyme n=2 Tax=Nocardia stercoris TaxID=2483361 RepID=A0A3M2L3H4_9NOCA|nr:aminotransferase class III-fold pyridoxal phosphate-dependent enzyme [Nocardia stercoris]
MIDTYRADRHVFQPWGAQDGGARLEITDGAGCWFSDAGGTRYLDLASQLVYLNLGHRHPALIDAVHTQADRLCVVAPTFFNEVRDELAAALLDISGTGAGRVLFTNGGTEAVEHAVRMARGHTGRAKILAHYRSYHGATAAAISISGDPRRWPNEPGVPGVVHFSGPYTYRSDFDATDDATECERALRHLERTIEFEGPHTVAAVILESVVGTNGILVPPDGYLAGVRRLCDRHGIVLICDEVMSGFGRVGEWFAYQRWNVRPDLVTFAKGVTSGYVPLGGVIVAEHIVESFSATPFPGGSTYSGHPLACAVGVASVAQIAAGDLLTRARTLGATALAPGLRALQQRHPSIGDVRGAGLFWALELVTDRDTKQPLAPLLPGRGGTEAMAAVAQSLREHRVWPMIVANRIHLAPPLIVSDDEVEFALGALDHALDVADSYYRA